jgi:hypothetical protein
MHQNIDIQRQTSVLQWLWCWTALAAGSLLALALGGTAKASDEHPQPFTEPIHDALEAWSDFVGTGDMAAIEGAFSVNGPQWRQFQIESTRPGDTTHLRLRALDSSPRQRASTTATVWAEVEVSGAGFLPRVFSWDFVLIKEDGHWLVWTVVPAQSPLASVERARAYDTITSDPTSTMPPATTGTSAQRTMEAGPETQSLHPPHEIRLPAISAWIIVVTLVGVAVAGYMAPRIDRRRGR